MSESALRAQIKSVLEGVSGIGPVHDYIRLLKRWNDFLSACKDGNDAINTVMFERSAYDKLQRTFGEIEKAHVYAINMIYGLNDAAATGRSFQALVEAVDAAFDSQEEIWNLSGITCHPDWGPMSGAVGLRVDVMDQRLFGDVLCHFAAGRLCLVETVT